MYKFYFSFCMASSKPWPERMVLRVVLGNEWTRMKHQQLLHMDFELVYVPAGAKQPYTPMGI
ncbi:hypothetical protein SNOG_14359 [Parastagonospora nodorum SN15]|uniref:Uncharacterized protein n=1 Tax=Phaeosphaeria nodorum (strain SN15 / ATCC MYA-4574 / FGSC 10173) TaxID=321614 RepID=Q0U1G9_PHANO|nr:hypothetical protein SNOG_14359 [Parastagonospora nodorum SN15]EAT78230.1 hypothetical protein SNOG_14359 [Parastagonospora nodorum SN15]